MRKYDLELRLTTFSVGVIKFTTTEMPRNYAANHLSSQLIRSGTSVALNYGEVQGAESRKDFIHKMRLVIKELRETKVCLTIIREVGYFKSGAQLEILQNENIELISIISTSIKTAQSKLL